MVMQMLRVASGILVVAICAFASVGQAADKNEIVVAQPVLRQQFDPTALVATTDFMPQDMLFDGLFNLTEKGITPALALSWVISDEGKQVDFILREGVTFHNGDPFTAEDVKFTLDRVRASDSKHAYRKPFQDAIKDIVVLAPNKVRFVLTGPWPGYFTGVRNATVGMAPKSYYEKVGPEGFQKAPIGTGPFKLKDSKAGEWTEFSAFNDYWGGRPNVELVKKLLVKEEFTRYAMLTRNEADIVMGISGPLLDKIRADNKARIIFSKYSGTSGFYFNKTSFPESQDPRVRLAIGHAIDLKAIAKDILGGVCEPASGIFTPATFGHLPGLDIISYDPEKSKKLLAEAGIKPGMELTDAIHTASFGSLPNAPAVQEAIAGYLEAVGFKIKREPYDTGAWLKMMRAGKQPDIFYGPSSIPDDGSATMESWFLSTSPWSSGNISIPEYDEIFKKQLVEPDLEKRRALLQGFAREEHTRHAGLPLFWCNTPFAIGPRVKEWSTSLGSGYQMNLDKLTLN